MEERDSSSININKAKKSNNDEIIEEINNFTNKFRLIIKNNSFLKKTIDPIICYMIRRFYYPSNFFKDQSIFIFDKNDENCTNLIHQNVRLKFEDLFYEDDEESLKNKIKDIQKDIKERMIKTNNIKPKLYQFQKDDVITLRNIKSSHNSRIYLVLHLKSFYIFVLKEYLVAIDEENNNEYKFVSNYTHRCLTQFYGLLKDNDKTIGFVYEFMCNKTLDDYYISNKDKINFQ